MRSSKADGNGACAPTDDDRVARTSMRPHVNSRTGNPRPWAPTAADLSIAVSASWRHERHAAARRRRFEHIVREKPLSIYRHHHDLDFVREAFRDDFLNQQR